MPDKSVERKPAAPAEKVASGAKRSNFQVSEAYKMIRTNLLFALSTTNSRTVIFSSAEPGAGKSTLSGNLAIVMAQTGSRVALVDADMRKPSQHRNFKIPRTMGLSKILSGLNTLDECICRDVKPNLDVIPAGTIPPNPSELLGSARMLSLLEELQEKYDYVFVDMPPLCVVADALVVAPNVAGVVLVSRHKQTTYDELNDAIENVKLSNANLLGVVLTCVVQEAFGYGRYGRYSRYGRYDRNRYYRTYGYTYGENEKSDD